MAGQEATDVLRQHGIVAGTDQVRDAMCLVTPNQPIYISSAF